MFVQEAHSFASADYRLFELGIALPPSPLPFGPCAEVVQTGNRLFLSGMLPTLGHEHRFIGRLGNEVDAPAGREAVRLATLNALSAAKEHLVFLNRISRVAQLRVYLATAANFADGPTVADAASEVLESVFGPDKMSVRQALVVANLPLGMPVELEVVFEIAR
jgi:enamine deaminase RidA (YjgF/YER057c/UK114 family)